MFDIYFLYCKQFYACISLYRSSNFSFFFSFIAMIYFFNLIHKIYRLGDIKLKPKAQKALIIMFIFNGK